MEVSGERYRMLDTVRHYALEKLDASGDDAAARQRHLDFYSQFVEQLRPRMLGPEQGTCMTMLDHERENILAAHAWCDRSDCGAETDLRMVFALKFYWLNRGLLGLGYRVTSEALARPHAQSRTLSRCRGLADAGQICYFMGRYAEAHELLAAEPVDCTRAQRWFTRSGGFAVARHGRARARKTRSRARMSARRPSRLPAPPATNARWRQR